MKGADRIGEKRIMKCDLECEIIAYRNCHDMDIKFEDGCIVYHRRYRNFIDGTIKHPNRKTKRSIKSYNYGQFCGFGIRDKKDVIELAYNYWTHMINRCYNYKIHKKNPTYINCEVCGEWKNYSNFEKWYNENYYEVDNEVMCLDKDILVKGNKIYSPETCVFAPERINYLFIKRSRDRGRFPIGVTIKKNGYMARINTTDNNGNIVRVYLGTFSTPDKAFHAYKQAKEKYIKQVADEYRGKVPQKLYDAMYNYKVEITD